MTDSGLPTSEHLEHLDTDTIADLIENLLPAPEAHRAREHVKACPDCQQTYDALVELSEDLAEEGRTDIPMPTDVAEHLDAVIVSESVLRASTVGVHSLAQIREEPRRHLPKLLGAAAAVVLVAAIGVGVVIATKDQAGENAANTNPTELPSGAVVTMTTQDIGPEAQQWLEHTRDPVLNALGRRGRLRPGVRVRPAEPSAPAGPAGEDRRQARHADRRAERFGARHPAVRGHRM